MARMLAEAPSLRARQLAKELSWQDLLVPRWHAGSASTPDAPDPRPRALVAAALGCFSAAVHVWTASGGTLSLPALLDQAMSAVDDRRPVSGPNTT
jgi:hypothetical protein